jgi:hypothetical protein
LIFSKIIYFLIPPPPGYSLSRKGENINKTLLSPLPRGWLKAGGFLPSPLQGRGAGGEEKNTTKKEIISPLLLS